MFTNYFLKSFPPHISRSNAENRRSLAIIVLEIFKKCPDALYFDVDISLLNSATNDIFLNIAFLLSIQSTKSILNFFDPHFSFEC